MNPFLPYFFLYWTMLAYLLSISKLLIATASPKLHGISLAEHCC